MTENRGLERETLTTKQTNCLIYSEERETDLKLINPFYFPVRVTKGNSDGKLVRFRRKIHCELTLPRRSDGFICVSYTARKRLELVTRRVTV